MNKKESYLYEKNIIQHEDLNEQFENTKKWLNKIKLDFWLGYMTTREKITTDYDYVCEFFSCIEEVLLKRIRK